MLLGRLKRIRNWCECTITCLRPAVGEVIRNMKTCMCCAVCTLPAMAIDPIEEAAEDLITSGRCQAQITSKLSKLKAVSQCGAAGGHCPSAALLRRARDCTRLGESESRSDIPSSWDSDSDPGRWAQCQCQCPWWPGALAHSLRVPASGAAAHQLEVRDCQGLWSGTRTRDQGPAPGLAQAA